MIKGAIFDVDGTLLDSMPIWDTIANDYLLSLGIKEEKPLAPIFKSFSQAQAAQYYIDNYGLKLSPEEITAGVNAMIADFYENKVQLKAGAAEFLQKLCFFGVRMCIATATDSSLVTAALSRCGVLPYFSAVFCCSEYGSKSSPEIYRAAAEHLGCEKAETWVFEDALHAASTAAKDDFPVAAVFDRAEKEPEELKKISRVYLEDMQDFSIFWKKASV